MVNTFKLENVLNVEKSYMNAMKNDRKNMETLFTHSYLSLAFSAI